MRQIYWIDEDGDIADVVTDTFGYIGVAMGADRILINKSCPQMIGYYDNPLVSGGTAGYPSSVTYAPPGTRIATFDNTMQLAGTGSIYHSDERLKMYMDEEGGASDAIFYASDDTFGYLRLNTATRQITMDRSNSTDHVSLPASRFRFYK